MEKIVFNWTEFKSDIINRGFPLNYRKNIYEDNSYNYEVFSLNREIIYICSLIDSSVITEFETYYKSKCNKLVYDSEGKEFQRAESRPLDCTTYFTTKGDSVNAIGEGAILAWDFGNQDNEIIQESGSLIRRKRIEFKFLDTIYIREGTMYFHNTVKGSYVDLYVV
jgi:hypothetical protein